jgi:hypothetical protein
VDGATDGGGADVVLHRILLSPPMRDVHGRRKLMIELLEGGRSGHAPERIFVRYRYM